MARGEFQDTTIVDQGNGWHKVVTSCPLYFPGISFEEDKGWILMETDVRTENYQVNGRVITYNTFEVMQDEFLGT